MGGWDQVKEWCEKAPFGTIAYYAGDGRSRGMAVRLRSRRDAGAGNRGARLHSGNTVDGPAMDWLMSQEAPRIMVTDRKFCDVADSQAQILRLENLEARGEITVQDYSK